MRIHAAPDYVSLHPGYNATVGCAVRTIRKAQLFVWDGAHGAPYNYTNTFYEQFVLSGAMVGVTGGHRPGPVKLLCNQHPDQRMREGQ